MPRRLGLLLVAAIGAVLIASDAPVAQDDFAPEGTAGALFVQQDKLIASRGARIVFGASIALSANGDIALIGAPNDNDGTGAAYVFTRRGLNWISTKLTARGAGFGASVALSANGRIALIGDPGFDDGRGAAYVFTRSTSNWILQARLRGSGRKGKSAFGWSVALSGDGSTALIGGPYDDRGFFDRAKPFVAAFGSLIGVNFGKSLTKSAGKGAAWFFTRSGSTWRQEGGKLTAKDARGRAMFGFSVALSGVGATALIGAPGDRDDKGAAWAFTRTLGSPWRQHFKLTGGPGKPRYGYSVALSSSGIVALVGGPAFRNYRGAVLTAIRSDRRWDYQDTVVGSGMFGYSVGLSANGSTGVVGAPSGKGEAWAVTRFGSRWARQRLSGLGVVGPAVYGGSAAISADGLTAMIGGPFDRLHRGAAWVFVTPPVVSEVLPASGPTSGGTVVTISGSGFTRVQAVRFGQTPAASFTVSSSTRITATSPPRRAAPVDVSVVTARGASASNPADRFTFVEQPVVTAISPSSGTTEGGTEVTITGTGFTGASAVRFGTSAAASFTVDSPTQVRAVTPAAQAGTVDITVTTGGGTSTTTAADRFTYVAFPLTVISFDELSTAGPQGGGARVVVDTEYAAQGVTFNGVTAIDYSKGSGALPGFARSGSVGIEQCFGVEFCTTPVRATFSAPQRLVRVWVGFSFALNVPAQVQLRALDANASVVGTATATLPANANPTPIRTSLEVRLATAQIRQFEVSIQGGFTNALALDDVTFQGG